MLAEIGKLMFLSVWRYVQAAHLQGEQRGQGKDYLLLTVLTEISIGMYFDTLCRRQSILSCDVLLSCGIGLIPRRAVYNDPSLTIWSKIELKIQLKYNNCPQ